jgi:hypothetical protein
MTISSAMSAPVGAPTHFDAPPELRIIDPLAYPDWDGLLATHPDANFFHSSGWARTLAAAYGLQCRYIAATCDNELRGLLPVIEARSWLRGTRGVSLPFTDECSPLVSRGVSGASLLKEAMREGTARGWRFLEIRGGDQLIQGVANSTSYYGHSLPLNPCIEKVFENFDSSVQRAIRKADRSGVTVHFGTDLDAVRQYYELHCLTRTKHGAPPQPFRFFHSIYDHILRKGAGFVALAMQQQRPIAGAVFFQFARKAIYKFSASDERCQEFRGPNLVIWRSIRKLIEGGVTELNFGKTSQSNSGLRRFKLGWGAHERLIHYVRYCFKKNSYVKIPDLAAGAQSRVFALLPVFLSRWIGRAAYAHLS